MRDVWLLMKMNIRRNLLAVVLVVAGAAITCLFLYSIGNMVADQTVTNASIGIIDSDKSTLSKDFKKYLTEKLYYNIVEDLTYDELSMELIDKNISVIMEIPEGFYQEFSTGKSKKLIVTSLEDFENAAFLEAYMNNYLNSISILAAGANHNPEVFDDLLAEYALKEGTITQEAALVINRAELAGKEGFINSAGFYLMFIFAIGVLLSFMIIDDRLTGTLSRIQITPVKPFQYIIGSGIFGLLLCLIQISLYCGYISLMEVQTGVPMGVIYLMMGLFSVFTICFSISISLALKTKGSITSVIIGFSNVGCIVGGAYFPLDFAPKSLQQLARIFPQYWFMDAFRSFQKDVNANIYPNIIILALFALLSLLAGAVLFSQNYKNS